MDGKTDKKRNIIINGETFNVYSRRIKLCESPEVYAAKVKLNDRWYIFELDTGRVIYQGNNWTDCLNGVKDIIKTYL